MSDLSNISTIKNILSRHGFQFSKSLGQNFLINKQVCPNMADACVSSDDYGVIEIGPGIGVLTTELAKRAKKVVTVELDKKLLPILNETLKDFNNVKIINADAMKLDFKKLIHEEFKNMSVCVCANLPYYITSPIIMKLLEEKLCLKNITVMVQKEAAERLCALPKTRNVGAISIAVRYFSEPEFLLNVPRNNFIPIPNVDSAVIKLNIRESTPVNIIDEKTFFAVVKIVFQQRRKVIANTLSSGFSVSKENVLKLLESIDISSKARPEELSLDDFAKISNKLSSK